MRFDRHQFNQAILFLAPLHVTRGHAPGTFEEIMQAPGIVWEGASDATVFGDARVNHAFRAWHDAHHIAGQFDFSLTGEIATMRAQQRDLVRAFPSCPAWALDIIAAEVQGQAEYFAAHGAFPLDQIAFTLNHAGVTL